MDVDRDAGYPTIMRREAGFSIVLCLVACAPSEAPLDAMAEASDATRSGLSDAHRDSAMEDAPRPSTPDTSPAPSEEVADELTVQRDRLFATLGDDACGEWAALDVSARAVFTTITHRLFSSRTPDGRSALSHVDRLYAVRGGGEDGTTCGGGDNNRLFTGMDPYLWARMVEAHDGALGVTDGGDGYWARSRDLAGPHDPFDASNETQSGLDCVLLVETADSRSPTAQAHFFLAGSARPISRGGIEVPMDPHVLEIDLDFDCLHRSNPMCRDFEQRYRESYGDFHCDWVPVGCVPTGEGCHRSVAVP